MKVPFINFQRSHQALREGLLEAMEDTLNSGQFILGEGVYEFEKAYAAIMGVGSVVGVNSGTSALHLCIRCCDIEAGDEVITTPFTFAASSWGIAYEKAVPVFADIDPLSYNLDPVAVEAAITPKTRAILVVHLFGRPAPMDDFVALAEKYGLKLIEDCAQAHLAQYKGRSVGLWGNCGAFSFYPTKNLGGLGEGGLVVSKEEAVTHRARILRNHAMTTSITFSEIGYNYRMEGFAGALLQVKLNYLKNWTQRRQYIAQKYLQEIRLDGLKLPPANRRLRAYGINSPFAIPRRSDCKNTCWTKGSPRARFIRFHSTCSPPFLISVTLKALFRMQNRSAKKSSICPSIRK